MKRGLFCAFLCNLKKYGPKKYVYPTWSLWAVKVEPPIADEVVLVEDGSVGAEEGVLGKATLAISSADVEHLALGFRVSIVSWKKKNLF